MHRPISIAILLGVLASCGSSTKNGDGQASAAASFGQRLQTLPDGQRDAVFIRAIRDAGLDCQHVAGSAPDADYRGMPVWNVRCDGGGNWTVVIGNDGIAQILNANQARLAHESESGNRQ
jgi:hypothetical protein